MFVQLKKGQLAFNKDTKEHGKIIAVNDKTYAVEVIVEQNKEEGTRTTRVVEFPKVYAVPYRKPSGKGKHKGFREYHAVREFHDKFNYPNGDSPEPIDAETIFKRIAFIQEELIELLAASVSNQGEFAEYLDKLESKRQEAVEKEIHKVGTAEDILELTVNQADALVDILYFTFGTSAILGVDPLPLFQIVQNSNLSKLDPETGEPIYNEFGKIQKGSAFIKPEPKLREEIQRQIDVAKKRADRDEQ